MTPCKHQADHGRRDMDRKVVSFVETEGRSTHERAVKDVTLQDATESTKDRVRRDDRGEVDQEDCLKRTEKLHIQDKAREIEKPGRRRKKPLRTSPRVCTNATSTNSAEK